MDKAQLLSSLNRLDILLIVFGVLVAIGVAGESVVGVLHWRRSNQLQVLQEAENHTLRNEVSVANTRANEAQTALEKIKTPRTLTDEQAARISGSLEQFAKTRFDMSVVVGDPEAMNLLLQMAGVLQKAGWVWVEWNHPTGPLMTVYNLPGKPNIGQGGPGVGVSVGIHEDHMREFERPATQLAESVKSAGLDVALGFAPAGVPNHDTIHIMVGKKAP